MKRLRNLLLLAVACLCHLACADAQEPGLAALHYGGAQFQYYAGSTVRDSIEYNLPPSQLSWPAEQRDETTKQPIFSRQGGWGMVLRGKLRTAQAGSYGFAGTGAEGLVRLDGAWFPLEGEHTLELPKGDLSFELYQRQRDRNKPLTGKLFWRQPGDVGFAAVPAAALTHTPDDLERKEALRPDIALANPDVTFATLGYRFQVPEDGFYRFFLRCAGDFRWGSICPGAATVAIDGQPLLSYYNAMSGRNAGFFDELAVTRHIKKGEHTLEIVGNGASHFVNYPALRLGFFQVNSRGNPDLSLSVSEKKPGVTVFRKGEGFTWVFERATGDQPPTYRVEVRRQRDAGDQTIWSGDATFKKNRDHARAELTYSCAEEGAFEYRIFATQGQLLEGPWEFVVIDPTPLPKPRLGAPEARPAMAVGDVRPQAAQSSGSGSLPLAGPSRSGYSGTTDTSDSRQSSDSGIGVLVDTIDCAEEAGGEHRFRDNGTSKVVTVGDLKYRKTGPHSEYVVYENVDNKGKEFIKRPRNYKENTGRLVGVSDQDWFAYTLKVRHPERAHLVVAWLPTDQYRRIGVEVIDPVTSHYNGSTLECKWLV